MQARPRVHSAAASHPAGLQPTLPAPTGSSLRLSADDDEDDEFDDDDLWDDEDDFLADGEDDDLVLADPEVEDEGTK